jgi:hypothetical protein
LPATVAETHITRDPKMQAIKLQRKYPQVSQEEMFALIERFKYVAHIVVISGWSHTDFGWLTLITQRD